MPSVPLDTKRLTAIRSTSDSSRSTSAWRSSSSITRRSRSSSISPSSDSVSKKSSAAWLARSRAVGDLARGPLRGIFVGLGSDAAHATGSSVEQRRDRDRPSPRRAHTRDDASGHCSSVTDISNHRTGRYTTGGDVPELADRRARTRRCRVRPWRSSHHRHVVPPSRARTSLARARRQREREDHPVADRRPVRASVEGHGRRARRASRPDRRPDAAAAHRLRVVGAGRPTARPS